MGKMGAGKTLSMSFYGSVIAKVMNVPLYANYGLDGAQRIETVKELWAIDNAIVCWDEIWLTLDARLWSNNVFLTRFINQTRKKKIALFYTTQHIRQVELRVRNGTDVLIYCEKKPHGILQTWMDWQYQTIGRKFILERPERFYGMYDTYEVLEPLKGTSQALRD